MTEADLQSRACHLLALAKNIRHYEEALSQATGEHFNLFEILHIGHYEVRTHSPILAELLNPRGSHGQGAVFLKHFLDVVKIQGFAAESARVEAEVSIGALGRIDIVINDGNGRSIFIENKIHAGLQEDQLIRYHKHDRNANLLFLTLEYEPPADWSTNPGYKTESFARVFQSISYRADIVQWLERCRKEVATAPTVREAITQYIHLIKRLTQQNTNARMNQEIVKAVTHDSSTYLAYATLRNEQWNIRLAIISKANALLDTIGGELALQTAERFACHGGKYERYFFTTDELKAQNLMFGLECQSADYRDFCFGFRLITPGSKSPIEPQIISRFKLSFPFNEKTDTNTLWPASPWWGQHRDWNDDHTQAAIASGEFAHELKSLISKLTEVGADAIKASAVPTKQA